MTLACEDGNSKLVEVVTVANDGAEKRVDDSLVQIWKLKFGHKATLLLRLWAQGLVKILKLKFRQDFEAEVWSVFCCWCLVEVTKLNLGQDSEARFGQDFKFKFSWDTDVWLRFWSKCLIEILNLKCDLDFWYELNLRVRCAFGNIWNRLSKSFLCCVGNLEKFYPGILQTSQQGFYSLACLSVVQLVWVRENCQPSCLGIVTVLWVLGEPKYIMR